MNDKFKISSSNYNVHNDISLVEREAEERSNLKNIAEIFAKSITNIIPILILVIMDCINLILLGQNNEDFINFEVGVIYLNLFCFAFSIGVIYSHDHSLEKSKDDGVKIYKIYLIAKDHILFIALVLVTPVALLSYYILFEFFDIWNIYVNFLVYSPIIIYFKLMILLNLRTLYKTRNNIWIIVICYFVLHISFSYLFIKSYGISGLTLAMNISSMITFIFSHVFYITKLFQLFNLNLLSLFKIDYNNSKQTLLSSTIKGFTTYLEYVGYGIITLSAYNMGDLFIPHIILYSILSIPHTISEGFGLTIKNYLIEMKHIKASYQSRKKYILSFVLLVITSALIFSLILLAFEDKLAALYYPSLTVDMKKLYSDVISYYSIFIIFDFFSVVLDGFITGKEGESNRLSIYKAIVFCLICIPIGFGFTFYYNVGIIGIWMTIFLYISIHFLVEIIYVYKVHGLYAFKE